MASSDLVAVPITGGLRVVGGARLAPAVVAAESSPPTRVPAGRAGERLYVLLDLEGAQAPAISRALMEVVGKAYWGTAGSITAALRQAASAASRHLFQINLRSGPSGRCYGGLACAVVRDEDVFILQVGSTQPLALHTGLLDGFGREDLPQLGIAPLTDVRLHHLQAAAGDTLLLASKSLLRDAGQDAIGRALGQEDVPAVLAGLEQVGAGTDFVGLVLRWSSSAQVMTTRQTPALLRPKRRREPPAPPASQPAARPDKVPSSRPEPDRQLNLGPLVGWWRAVRSFGGRAGRAVAGVATRLAGGTVTLVRRMLPGPERDAYRRSRPSRPAPQENPAVMTIIAVVILLLVIAVVAFAYTSFGKEERIKRLMELAQEQVAQAEVLGGSTQDARPHWQNALTYAEQLAVRYPGEPAAQAAPLIREQAQAALDVIDRVHRVEPVSLWEFGSTETNLRLVVHGQTVFVLDPIDYWVVQLNLEPLGQGVIEEDGSNPVLINKGQPFDGDEVGELVDMAWVEAGGERQTNGLVILEKDGALVSYDPAWEGEGGYGSLSRSLLGTPPEGEALAVGSFEGRFYILDPVASQIWRYEPQGSTYPHQPDRYFVTQPPPLAEARDMAIDGNVYVLYADGTIHKFLQREPQPFEIREVPGGMGKVVAFAIDQQRRSGRVYLADQVNRRVVEVEPDGAFHAQYRAETAFEALDGLAVDEMARRLFVISGGTLYLVSLP